MVKKSQHLVNVVCERNPKHEKCSKFLLTFQDRYVDEAEFKTSGGVSGYIARAKNLMDTRKLYTEAIK